MNKVKKDHSEIYWVCPGCKEVHAFPMGRISSSSHWFYNGNEASPTISPSLTFVPPSGGLCHFFIRDGVIEFLGDSTHALAGKKRQMDDVT